MIETRIKLEPCSQVSIMICPLLRFQFSQTFSDLNLTVAQFYLGAATSYPSLEPPKRHLVEGSIEELNSWAVVQMSINIS